MKVTLSANDLLWMLSFCSKDLTDNRGFAQLILTKILDKTYLIGTDGNSAMFYGITVDNPEEMERGINYCVYFNKNSINALKNIHMFEEVTINFKDNTFWSISLPQINCFPYRVCDTNMENWIKNFKKYGKIDQNTAYLYRVDAKKLTKFIYNNPKIVFSLADDRILLIKLPDKLNCFGFICRYADYEAEDTYNKDFENLVIQLNNGE